MEIVPFSSQDQSATAAFMRVIYEEMGWPDQPEDKLDDLSNFFHLPHDGALLLIKKEDKVVGTGGFVRLTEKDLLLKRFYIAETLRGSGIAQELWSRLLEHMKSFGATRVVLDVRKTNTRAIRFYEKNGFVQYEQEPIKGWEESNYPERQSFYYLEL